MSSGGKMGLRRYAQEVIVKEIGWLAGIYAGTHDQEMSDALLFQQARVKTLFQCQTKPKRAK